MKSKTLLSKSTPEKVLTFIAVLSVILGIVFRSYNLSWGAPYFFHPDERNIANSVSQLEYPVQMNPHFFAYGTLPIYAIYFTGVVSNSLGNLINENDQPITKVRFEDAIVTGRSFSLLLSILLLPLLYKFSKEFWGKKAALIGVTMASLSVGFIQYAHFATFEMWLTFFSLLSCYLTVKYHKTGKLSYLFFTSGIIGMLLAIKISSLVFILPPLGFIIFQGLKKLKIKKNRFLNFEKIILTSVIFLAATIIIPFLSTPYLWIDSPGFLHSMRYESSVGLGTVIVFYTQRFIDTQPILFQVEKIYPFLINPLVLITMPLLLILGIKRIVNKKDISLFIVYSFLAIAFFSQAFLFAKWTRYYIPTLSFIYLIIGITLSRYSIPVRKINIKILLFSVLTVFSFISSFSYFKTVLYNTDSRVEAANWAAANIPSDAPIISEVFDMGIIPFNPYFLSIVLFDFYELENNPSKITELNELIDNSDYIILPSQRLYEARISRKEIFPLSSPFYRSLGDEEQFRLLYKTPCDIFCKILYLNDPEFSYEHTVSVFDRPTVRIYRNEQKKDSRIKE